MLYHLTEPGALVGIALAFIVGVLAHDTAQVLAARLARDPMPARAGRMTASLATRISPFSVVAVLVAGYGWAEPVKMNDIWRKRRFHISAALLAGPLAYLVLAFAMLAVFVLIGGEGFFISGGPVPELGGTDGFVEEFVVWMAMTFGAMFILSLLPVPPTDGGRILFLLAPQSPGWRKAELNLTERNWGLGILLAVIVLPVIFRSLPSVVDQLMPPLVTGLGSLLGL